MIDNIKDYYIVLSYDGLTEKNHIEGYFYPNGGEWTIENYEKGIKLLQYGESHLRNCLVKEKQKILDLRKEINEITKDEIE